MVAAEIRSRSMGCDPDRPAQVLRDIRNKTATQGSIPGVEFDRRYAVESIESGVFGNPPRIPVSVSQDVTNPPVEKSQDTPISGPPGTVEARRAIVSDRPEYTRMVFYNLPDGIGGLREAGIDGAPL